MYLADFGLARIAQSGESTLSSDMIMGTPQYISPEQAMGKKDLDAGTDIYSFAVMLYEMVVGQVPFSADTPFSIIHDHIYTPLPLPQTINPNVPEPVQRVLLKALSKERTDRYATVGNLVDAFKSAWHDAGVPMKGTSVTIAKPVASAEATRVKSASEPTKMAAKSQVAEQVAQPQKKRSSFVWVVVVILLVACVSGLVFARQNRLFTRLLTQGQSEATTAVDTPVQNPIVLAPTPVNTVPVHTPLPPNPQPSEQNLSPQVVEAQKNVKANPNDPNAQLDLALAFWTANMPGATYDTLLKVINIVGPKDEQFYTQAGEKFASLEGWLPAAAMYFQARKIYGLDGNVPDHLVNSFHEATYKGADKPEAHVVLPFDKIAQVDQPIALIAQSRNAFYSGHIDDANTALNQVKRLAPNMSEAFLLEAEFDSVTGKNVEAKLIANGLRADLAVPDWIRSFAEEIIKKLP